MQNNLRALTAAGIQACREDGRQVDAVEVAYIACLLEEQQAWSCPAASSAAAGNTAAAAAASTTDTDPAAEPQPPADASQPQQQPQQQQQKMTLCSTSKLPEAVLATMAERLRRELLQPADLAAAATAQLQVALERSFKEQQDKVEAEQARHTGATARLASAVAYKKVNIETAGLPLYQQVFGQVVDYVCAAAGLEAKAASDPDARAQVSAAVDSVLPLSGLAYFLTLPAQERMQQLESLAAISCGICLFNSHTGNAGSPIMLSADTQLLQAGRLLSDIEAAAGQAQAALDFYNMPQQQSLAATNPALAAAAAAYLGSSSSSGSASGASAGGSISSASKQLGAALYCCQAAVALRTLATDLAAGISCCRQLHNELLSVLSEAAQITVEVAGAAVPKEQVFPLFESAGRMHLALKGELRLLLVRGRLWEDTYDALTAAAEQPGVPKVLGFRVRPYLGSSSSAGGSLRNSPATAMSAKGSICRPAVLLDTSSLPADMEYVPSAAATAAAEEAGDGLDIVGGPGGLQQLQQEQQVLALAGMCPVSIAGRMAPGAAAAGVSCTDADLAAGEQPLVGHMAQPELGMIRYGGQLYGFSSPAALAAFVSGPESMLDAVCQAAHNTPLLLHALGLSSAPAAAAAGVRPTSSASGAAYGNVSVEGSSSYHGSTSSSPVTGVSGAGSTAGYRGSSAGARKSSNGGAVRWRMPPLRGLLELFAAPLKVEAGTQTVTHPVERFIDIDYEWNEWALRRRIIALANLRLKATHGAQTLASGFRREGCSQTWLPKEATVQTMVSKGSSVPQKLRYVTGLRGAPNTKMQIVSLELDVHGKGANVKPGRL